VQKPVRGCNGDVTVINLLRVISRVTELGMLIHGHDDVQLLLPFSFFFPIKLTIGLESLEDSRSGGQMSCTQRHRSEKGISRCDYGRTGS
jgi:hypothetical protein